VFRDVKRAVAWCHVHPDYDPPPNLMEEAFDPLSKLMTGGPLADRVEDVYLEFHMAHLYQESVFHAVCAADYAISPEMLYDMRSFEPVEKRFSCTQTVLEMIETLDRAVLTRRAALTSYMSDGVPRWAEPYDRLVHRTLLTSLLKDIRAQLDAIVAYHTWRGSPDD
jgi:hypothetical protein